MSDNEQLEIEDDSYDEKEPENIVGRWKRSEEEYIFRNYKKMSVDEIAKNLRRNPDTVRKYVKDKILKNSTDIDYKEIARKTEFDIKNSPIWVEITQQFTLDEQDTFIYHWTNIMSQFKNDVYATERMQVLDVCRNEILINRVLKKMKDITSIINDMQKELDDEYKKPVDARDVAKIIDLKRIVAETTAGSTSFSREYKELTDKKNATLREIKGTREQRIKRIEDSRESITSWMTNVVDNPEYRKTLSMEAERFRLAMAKETERLSEYISFGDDIVEQPILNSDTIKGDNV